ncbi:MAG: BtpA/SgcQ family protein [Candidatus Bathyarchaeia archaeon]
MSSILHEIFRVNKPVIGMVHMPPLPGSPKYDYRDSMEKIVKRTMNDAVVLERGGVDGLLFSNESDTPFLFDVGPETVAAVTYIVAKVTDRVSLPFGIDILWDPYATIAVAKATKASFVRTLLTGTFSSDLGLINTEGAKVLRYRKYIGAENVRIFLYLNPEFAAPISPRPLGIVAQTVRWLSLADVYCISGPMPGLPPDEKDIISVKESAKDMPILANTGINKDNIATYFKLVDGAIVGTSFKVGNITLNPVDEGKVKEFMNIVNSLR